MNKEYYVTVNIKLRFLVNAKNKDEAIEKVENAELPRGYVEDSFEIDKIEEAEKATREKGLYDEDEMIKIE